MIQHCITVPCIDLLAPLFLVSSQQIDSNKFIFSRSMETGVEGGVGVTGMESTHPDKSCFFNTIKHPSHEKVVNKFCFVNQHLRIETVRKTIPKTPENLRSCPFCNLNEVEIFKLILTFYSCHLYNNLCLKFFEDIKQKRKSF